MKITICLIGGHLSPALAVAQYIKQNYADYSLMFIGRKNTFSSEYDALSVESVVMDPYTDKTNMFPIERMSLNPLTWISVVQNIYASYRVLKKEKPALVVSFGGYVAIPVVIASALLRIPIITHEQSHQIGGANKFTYFFAQRNCVSYPELLSKTTKYTGFPLRQEMISPPPQPSFPLSKKKPIIYITGGTTGALSINTLLFSLIAALTESYTVVHQTGTVSFSQGVSIKESLPAEKQERYVVQPYIHSADSAWLMYHASLLIGRAGANTVYELAVTKIPSILIPLSLPGNTEQQENAAWLKKYAQTTILSQKEITLEMIKANIKELMEAKPNGQIYPSVPLTGTQQFVNELVDILS